jgi:O-antigen/teichoic acid export membrane protein
LLLGVTLDIILIPAHGASGAAIATSVALITGGVTSMVLYARLDPFPLRALWLPRRGDLALLRALTRPFGRARGSSGRDAR